MPRSVLRVKTSAASPGSGNDRLRSSATGVFFSLSITATDAPVWPLASLRKVGDVGLSGKRSKVEAVIQRAVAEDSRRPATATRAISTCSLPASGPRSGANQRRQPPARRATSPAPDRVNTSMAAAPAATARRPPSPRSIERCRLVSHRWNGLGSAAAILCPVAGSMAAACGAPSSNQ